MEPANKLRTLGLAMLALVFGSTSLAFAATAPDATFEIEVGTGYDSNPHLTPDSAYYDQVNQVSVTPDPRSAFFIPLSLRGGFVRSGGGPRWVTDYALRGSLYPGSEASNASEYDLRLAPGLELVLGREGRRENTLRFGPLARYDKQTYFDRDTGFDTVTAGEDVSQRYTYASVGAEATLDIRTPRRADFSFEARYEARNYADTPTVSSLDHDLFLLGAEVELDLGRSTGLYLDYRYYTRDYDERAARLLDGRALTANPRLEYAYHQLGTTLRTRPVRPWTLYLDWAHRTRGDQFEGYNDYNQQTLGLRSILKLGRVRWRTAIKVWDRSYDNAFIFDLPTNPQDGSANPAKAYQTLQVDLSVAWPLRRGLGLFVELEHRGQDAEDPRFAYDRQQLMAGIEWNR